MSIQNEKISVRQLFLLIVGFSLGTSVILVPGREVNQDAWLAILLGLVEGMFFAFIYTALANRFPGKTLIEISEIICGPYLGKIWSVLFLVYIFHLGSLVLTNLMDFMKFTILPLTPEIVVVLLEVMVVMAATTAGIEVIGRCASIFIILSIVFFLIIDLSLITKINLTNLQPVLETSWIKLLITGHEVAAFPFGETVVFLMVFPFMNSPHKSRSTTFLALLFAGVIFIFASLRNIGVLGSSAIKKFWMLRIW